MNLDSVHEVQDAQARLEDAEREQQQEDEEIERVHRGILD